MLPSFVSFFEETDFAQKGSQKKEAMRKEIAEAGLKQKLRSHEAKVAKKRKAGKHLASQKQK